jgi:hypothetical protein
LGWKEEEEKEEEKKEEEEEEDEKEEEEETRCLQYVLIIHSYRVKDSLDTLRYPEVKSTVVFVNFDHPVVIGDADSWVHSHAMMAALLYNHKLACIIHDSSNAPNKTCGRQLRPGRYLV